MEHEDTLSGRLIADRYRILGTLGQGGIGRVYAADQVGLDRRVALKVIRRERRADLTTERRFVREARAAGRITSPHVVRLYDSGRDDQGRLYIAMEHLEGQSLERRMRYGRPFGVLEAVRIGAQIARGLAAAHEAGVLHRDLKPGNVFLCDDGTVKVLDFGIAKLVDEDHTQLTAVHRILGTPVYMSPEAVARKPLGYTTDLYALGMLLFEMIAGYAPFRCADAISTLHAQMTLPAPRLGSVAHWTRIPPALEELVATLLRKEPDERPQSASELAAALERIARTHEEPTIIWQKRAQRRFDPEPRPSLLARVSELGVRETALAALVFGALMFVAVLFARLAAG